MGGGAGGGVDGPNRSDKATGVFEDSLSLSLFLSHSLARCRSLSLSLSLSDGGYYKLDVRSRSLACVKLGSGDLTVA